MLNMNILKFGIFCHKPRCWLKNISQFFRNLKYAKQRATRGYSDPDIWNLDDYISQVIANTAEHLSNNFTGYPPEITEEIWKQELHEISEHMNTYLHLKDIAKTKEDSILMQQEYQTALLMLQQRHMDMWD